MTDGKPDLAGPLPDYVITILATVYNDVMNTCAAKNPELARDNDFQNLIASTLLDLAHAGQVGPRELTKGALAAASGYVGTKEHR